MMEQRYDAVVIGAGPAGASVAILLARAGWSVALVEKQRFPRRKVCGECIAASNLPLLDALGVGDAVARTAGAPLRRVALMRGAEEIVAALPPSADPVHRWGRALGREHLDSLLVERASKLGATLWQPWALHEIGGVPGDFSCRVEAVGDGRSATLHAPIVVAAHGSWEALPSQRAARRRARRPSDLFAFKANFEGAGLAADLLPVLSFDAGYGGMVVADHAVTTLACCIREDRLAACRRAMPGAPAGDAVEALLRRECDGVARALDGATRAGAWLASGPIHPGVRMPRAGADVFLVGNAAGEAHPIVGEGISMALQSAWLLCDRLVRNRAGVLDAAGGAAAQRRLQRAHAAEWRGQFSGRIRLAAAFAHAAMRPGAMDLVLPVLRRWPALLTEGARWSGKVRCAPGRATIELLSDRA